MTKFSTRFRQYFYIEVVSEGTPTDELTAEEVAYESAYQTYKDADFWIQSDKDSMVVLDGPYVDENYVPETDEVGE